MTSIVQPPSPPMSSSACENCAETRAELERLRARLEDVQVAKEDDLNNFAVDIANKNREIARLKNELETFLDQTPGSKLAKSLFEYWRDQLGKRANTVYGTARKKAVLTALKQHDEETIKKAIDGAAKMPFVGPHGRQPTADKGAKRFDDLTLILRDETTIERFGTYVDAPEPAVPAYSKPVEPSVWASLLPGVPPIDLVYQALSEAGCNPFRGSGDWWNARCPLHDDRDPSFRFHHRPDGSIGLFCHGPCKDFYRDQKAFAEAACQVLDLQLRDLYPKE